MKHILTVHQHGENRSSEPLGARFERELKNVRFTLLHHSCYPWLRLALDMGVACRAQLLEAQQGLERYPFGIRCPQRVAGPLAARLTGPLE